MKNKKFISWAMKNKASANGSSTVEHPSMWPIKKCMDLEGAKPTTQAVMIRNRNSMAARLIGGQKTTL